MYFLIKKDHMTLFYDTLDLKINHKFKVAFDKPHGEFDFSPFFVFSYPRSKSRYNQMKRPHDSSLNSIFLRGDSI